MPNLNENYLKLQENYLFSEIAHRVAAYTKQHPEKNVIRLGQGVILSGILLLLLPIGEVTALLGLLFIGLGCAPVYPCIIHSTPEHFGAHRSQAMIGVQMASAYIGTCLMPPVFGWIVNTISPALFPVYLLFILVLMFVMHEKILKQTQKKQP